MGMGNRINSIGILNWETNGLSLDKKNLGTGFFCFALHPSTIIYSKNIIG